MPQSETKMRDVFEFRHENGSAWEAKNGLFACKESVFGIRGLFRCGEEGAQ